MALLFFQAPPSVSVLARHRDTAKSLNWAAPTLASPIPAPMSVSASTSPANPRDTARLVLEMNSSAASTTNNLSGSSSNATAAEKSGGNSSSSNNDKIDPNLKFVDDENGKLASKKDTDGDEIMTEEADAKSLGDEASKKSQTQQQQQEQQQQEQQQQLNASDNIDGGDHNKEKTTEDQKNSSDVVLSEEEAKKKELFFTSLKDLTENISSTIAEISVLIPKIYDQNSLFNSYSNFLINSNTFEPYNSYIAKVEGISNTSTTASTADNNGDSSSASDPSNPQDPNDPLNLHQQARVNRFYHKLYAPLPMIPGTRIPEIDLNNQAKTVKDVWDEWTLGHKNNPALQELEKKYGTRWRRGRIAKSAQRRKKVIEFIESEYKRHKNVLPNVLTVVQDLENYRILKGKGLFWLYGALPDRLYDDAGRPLFKSVNDVAGVNDEEAPNSKISAELENGNANDQENDSDKKTAATGDSAETLGKDKTDLGKTDDDKIDDDLKAVDTNNNNSSSTTTTATKSSGKDDYDLQKKEQQSITGDDMDLDQLNSSEKSKSIPNEEEEEIEDEDEEDDDDVNMPSVADVAAMASMSVEGEDDEHALVDSAALAVAAQHVADQQRLRDRAKSSGKSQNSHEEGDLNNYISTEDGLNENTDPALSKL